MDIKSESVLTSLVAAKREKPKRKNSEKRKEKSRKAARERRSQESRIFDQIEEILPVSPKALDHLDKASLVRIAINYLKLRSVIEPFKFSEKRDLSDSHEGSASLETLNGFVYILSKDGDLVYLSENVEHYLGLAAIDMIGQSIYDYTHPCDHDDIKAFLEPLSNACNACKLSSKSAGRNTDNTLADAVSNSSKPLFVRIKSTLTNKGRNVNLKSANYKVAKFTGRMIDLEVASPEQAQAIGNNNRHYMIGVGELIQHPSRAESLYKRDIFVSKHSPDMKFVYVDDSVETLLGFSKTHLIGTSLYDYFDARDFGELKDFFKTLFAKGQCDSGLYKFLVKSGGYRWISSQATILRESNSNKPQSVYFVHQIISGIESPELIVSSVQQEAPPSSAKFELDTINNSTPTIETNIQPVSSTISVIRPKAEIYKVDNIAPPPALYKLSCKPNDPPQAPVVVPVLPLPVPSLSSSSSTSSPSVVPPLQSSTETVLAPKTADMESGFIVFTDDNQGMTILSDAEDLTHLAPDSGDLCGSEMDLNDISMLDDLFMSASFNNTNLSNIFADDLFSFTSNGETDKIMKIDVGTSMNMDAEHGGLMRKLGTASNSYFELVDKDGPELKCIDNLLSNQQYMSNDPFLSYTSSSQQSDDPFLNPTCLSSDSLGGSFSSRTANGSGSTSSSMNSSAHNSNNNSPLSFSSSPSSLSNSMNFSPQSSCSDDMSNKLSLSDSIDFLDDKELEMRAPFIPIDDDYLLDFAYSDANIDDLFDWISNGKSFDADDCKSKSQSQPTTQVPSMPSKNSACLEALLQNDELMCSLKNKMYSSNQILNSEHLTTTSMNTPHLVPVQRTAPIVAATNNNNNNNKPTPAALKRKNSNILICTTIANSGDKKIKNVILNNSPDNANTENGSTAKLDEKTNVHHFVLTKNNELIPKASLANQTYKVSSKRVLPLDASLSFANNNSCDDSFKQDGLKRSKNYVDKTNSNSVLLNLLVNGADLSNGYKIMHSYQSNNNNTGNTNNNINRIQQRQQCNLLSSMGHGAANLSI